MYKFVFWMMAASLVFSPQTSSAQSAATYNTGSTIRIQLTPVQHTVMSSEISGRIASINVREGESFRAGQTLLALDCSLHQARLDKATAQAAETRQILNVNQQLDRLGSISVLEVEVAIARLAAAEAEATLMRAIVDRCIIKAPYAGKVSVLSVRAHQYVAEGQEMIGILDDSRLDIEMNVPSRWLPSLSIGQGFMLQLDETGTSYPAVIDRLGAMIDPVSQSVKIYGRMDGDFSELVAGMSGIASFELTPANN